MYPRSLRLAFQCINKIIETGQADPNIQAFLAKTTLVEKRMAKFHVRIVHIVIIGTVSGRSCL
jgi:hypothetical protein